MIRKIGILAATVAAALALTAAVGSSATALTGGHFTSAVENTWLVGGESGNDRTEFVALEQYVSCEAAAYEGFAEAASKTVTEVKMSPLYDKCITTSDESAVTVTENECTYVFTIGKKAHEDNTVHLSCPAGKKLEVQTSACKLSIGPQTFKGGVSYTTITENQKHALTIDVTIKEVKYERHGLCQFVFPTNGTDGELKGWVPIAGFNLADGKPVDITATGSEGT